MDASLSSFAVVFLALALGCSSNPDDADSGAPGGQLSDAADAGSNDAGGDLEVGLDADVRDSGPRDTEGAWRSLVATRPCRGGAWALGLLRFIPVAEFPSWSFGPGDLVLTDSVPATLPPAGAVFILTSAPLPTSLYDEAESARIPLVAWPEDDGRLEALVGQELAVVAESVPLSGESCELHVDSVGGLLTDDERTEIMAARANPTAAPTRALLLPRPTPFCAVGQEQTSVFALHRHKPSFILSPKREYVAAGHASSLIEYADLSQWVEDDPVTAGGAIADLPGASFTVDDYVFRNSWTAPAHPGYRFALEIARWEVDRHLMPGAMPLILLDHATANYVVTYPEPIMDPGWWGPEAEKRVELWPCSVRDAATVYTRTIDVLGQGQLEYEVRVGGLISRTYFTSPIIEVSRLELTGLFGTTISVTNTHAVSASADHHNFSENLIVEPGRDPATPQSVLDALEASDVRAIYFKIDLALSAPNTVSEAYVQGLDGTWRAF